MSPPEGRRDGPAGDRGSGSEAAAALPAHGRGGRRRGASGRDVGGPRRRRAAARPSRPWRSASRCWPGSRASLPAGSGRPPAPGETVVVPAGTRHAYRNTGDEVAHVICHARPPSSLQEFLEDAAALGRAGKLTRHALPKSFSALLQAAVMAHHYRDMVVLGFPLPPPRSSASSSRRLRPARGAPRL